MSTDDNVVRLKHLSSLASSIAAEIATLSGGSSASAPRDADFALYVPNNTSIIVTGKQPPQLSIGSWSYAGDIYNSGNSAKVYSAPVIYNGDGTLSTDTGTISNGVLTVHDTDGIFEGVISAAPGNEYAASSLYFNHDLDPVTVSSDANINAAIQSVGAKFVPAVDNASDFAAHADNNIQFFDNRIKKILDGGKDYVAETCNSFLNGTTTVNTQRGGDYYISTSSVNVVGVVATRGEETDFSDTEATLSANPTTYFLDSTFFKLSERTGIILLEPASVTGNYQYPLASYAQGFILSYSTLTSGFSICYSRASLPNTIANANSSNASCEGYQDITALNSPNSNSIFFLGKSTDKDKTYGTKTTIRYNNFALLNENSSVASVRVTLEKDTIPTIYGALAGSTGVHANYCDFADAYAPVIEFNGEVVSFSKGSKSKKIPLLCFDSVRSNSSGEDTVGGSYVYFGVADNARLAKCQLTTIQSGVTTTLNPWVEDDGSVILGLYPAKYNNQYIITYKQGSYTKSNWLNNAFDVWIVENTVDNTHFTKTTKKITDIIDEIV